MAIVVLSIVTGSLKRKNVTLSAVKIVFVWRSNPGGSCEKVNCLSTDRSIGCVFWAVICTEHAIFKNNPAELICVQNTLEVLDKI